MTAMMKLGLAPGNGLRTYEQYYDAVEDLPSPLLSVSELRQEAASSSTSRRRSNRTDPNWEAFHETCTTVKWVLGLSHLLSRDLAGIDWDCSSNGDMAVAARNGSPAAIPLLAAEGPYPFFIVPQRTRDCVALLCQRMCDSITGCVENTRPAVRDDRRMEIAHHVGRTNLLSSIADALTGCKHAMQQLQLQTELQRLPIEQPMREAATSLVSFAHSVLTLFNGIAAIWPITLLTGEENPMVEAVEPAAELAAAFLKQLSPSATAELAAQASAAKAAAALSAVTSSFVPTADASSSSSSSSPSGSNDKLKAALLDAVSAAICTADLLAFRMFQECADEGPPVEPEEKQSRTLLVSNKELQALLLAHLGYITQEMHSSMRGKTAVSAAAMLQPKAAKQQQQQQQQQQQRQQPPVLADVEPHHRKLLQLVLGVQFIADVSEVSRTPDISPASATNTMFALIYQMQALGPAVYHAVRVNKRPVARGEEEDEEDGIYDAVIPTFWAGITLTVVNMAEPAAVSVAMAADPRTAAITLEAALRLQHSAITQQLPGALEDEETQRIRIREKQVDQLMVFAHKWCNNPSCSNMSGLSEALLAKKRCSACKVARHCCPGCQAAQWPQHKVVCKRLRAAQQQQQA
ncbi:hypothetical protein OEZ86_001048 [Tetradesmus obliquus]|nr:hypothetical protein OEZ86_001048 [Tetradesmus obliquus]